MSSQIDKIVRTYRNIAQIPALTGAKLYANGAIITTLWSQRHLERGKTVKYIRNYFLDNSSQRFTGTTPVDVSQELISAVSPTEKLRALIREVIEAKDTRKQLLEVWSSQNLIHSVDLTGMDIHGDVYADGEFGSLEWASDETKLIYLAEKKPPITEPFYKQKKKNSNKNVEEDSKEVSKGEEFLYRQDWGEQLVGKIQTAIIMFDLKTEDFKILEGIPSNICPAQLRWDSQNKSIVGVAYNTDYRKLGLIYCSNRLSNLFSLDLDGSYVELLQKNKSVKSPRFTPDGKHLIWLQRSAGGPHHACMELVKTDAPLTAESKVEIVVPIVEVETKTTNGKSFYGLYNTGFPNRCWANDNRTIILSTNQKNTVNSYMINIENGIVVEITEEGGSLIVLDVKDDTILANRRNYFCSDKLLMGRLPASDSETVQWNNVTEPIAVDGLQNYEYDYLDLTQPGKDSVRSFSAIYLGPKNAAAKEVPLIVWPHGGPHSAFFNCMALETNLYALKGYAMVMINYRGSVGAGQKSVDFLLGQVGTTDVSDCILAVNTVLQKHQCVNPNKMALVGGSHGGFLVAHLSGQYPDMFRCVVARNPVIDIASMSIISDIPDWCSVEAGAEYSQVGKPSDELLLAMRNASPIMHAHKVKAPTLLQIGSKDLRVPPHQALDYYHRLKANGTVVRMNLYDDNHPLGAVPNELDNCINGLLWIQKHFN